MHLRSIAGDFDIVHFNASFDFDFSQLESENAVTTNLLPWDPPHHSNSRLSGRDLDISQAHIPRGEDSTHENCGLSSAGQISSPEDLLYQIQFDPHSTELSYITPSQVLEPNIPERPWLLPEPERPASFYAVEAPKPSFASQSPLVFNSLSQNFHPVSHSLSPTPLIAQPTAVPGSLGSLHQLDISLPTVENFVLIDEFHYTAKENLLRPRVVRRSMTIQGQHRQVQLPLAQQALTISNAHGPRAIKCFRLGVNTSTFPTLFPDHSPQP